MGKRKRNELLTRIQSKLASHVCSDIENIINIICIIIKTGIRTLLSEYSTLLYWLLCLFVFVLSVCSSLVI